MAATAGTAATIIARPRCTARNTWSGIIIIRDSIAAGTSRGMSTIHRHHYYNHYRGPAPHHYGGHHHPGHYRSSSAPIILGSVIGGVVGHEIGYGDPGHTAAGAVIGTVIGYEIARHR